MNSANGRLRASPAVFTKSREIPLFRCKRREYVTVKWSWPVQRLSCWLRPLFCRTRDGFDRSAGLCYHFQTLNRKL